MTLYFEHRICVLIYLLTQGIATTFQYQPTSAEHYSTDKQTVHKEASNVSVCPTWFVFNTTTRECECGDDLGGIIHCDKEEKRVYIVNCQCMTVDSSLGVVVGSCFTNCYPAEFNKSFEMYFHVPQSVTELNDAMCSYWNRDGRFCGQCKHDFYPLVYSYNMKCAKCANDDYNWIKFVLAAFLPLTVFFVFIISTGISVSSPDLDAFVVFSQTIATPANVRIVLEATRKFPSAEVPVKIISTLYGVWNLDFFRTLLPPICLKISLIQALALDYSIAFYPLFLLVLVYTLIHLYEKRLFLLVWIWKPFSVLFNSMSSRVNVKASVINAFLTFLLLAYVKLLSVSFDLLSFTTAYDPFGNKVGTFLYYDAFFAYFGKPHLPYGILAIAVVSVFIVLPLLFTLLHPLACMRPYVGRWPALRICLDSYQGYYKDGTGGSRDYRWFSSLYLFARISLFLVYGFIKNVYFYPFASILLLIVVALIVICQPFKSQFGKYNTIHALLFLNLSMWFASTTLTHTSALKAAHLLEYSLVMCGFLAIVPLLYATYLVLGWTYKHKIVRGCLKKCCVNLYFDFCNKRDSRNEKEEYDSIDSIPYRVDHPNEERVNLIKSTSSEGGISYGSNN